MPDKRIRQLNSAPMRPQADYVLYWSQMNRRVESNHALAHAAAVANGLNLPLLVYEGLTCSYPYANDRLHTFILEGVPSTAAALRKRGIGYCFYLRRRRADPNDVLYRIAARAAAVVTDDYPTFVASRHNASVPGRIGVAYFAVDASCIVPMSAFEKREYAAYTIRPKIKRLLPEYLQPVTVPSLRAGWNRPTPDWHVAVTAANVASLVSSSDIDHSVPRSTAYAGGYPAARQRLDRFLEHNLRRYARHKNEPSEHATSHLSPYLHFGHISSLEVALAASAHAATHKVVADEFLEELIVRRELAFNFTRFTPNYDSLASLPAWAEKTLAEHDGDPRPGHYTAEQMEQAATGDALWDATQKELLLRGTIHGYYRMYWGKKIIEWSESHAAALELMIRLHDRYALDGRDPNTYTNVLWCFGLHDRPWFERPIFGTIRYMSGDGMRRKTDVDAYIREIGTVERTGKDPVRL